MNILIVDDEEINRFLLRHMLEEDGYTSLYEASGGEQALQVFAEQQPDIVLLDVVMPDLNGLEVARRIKASTEQYIPIIFITSLDDEESLVECLEAGGDDFFSKPFNRVTLSAKIKAHSRTREMSLNIYRQNLELTYHQNNIKREHKIVEHIFSNVLNLNASLASLFDFRIAPASNFNGDLLLLEQSPNGGLYVLLGDFTGHGLASAIGALPISRVFHNMGQQGSSVSEMANIFNQILLDFLPGDMFFAAAVIEIAENGCLLDVWNGGLPDLLVVDSQGNIKKRFESMHMALGILDQQDFESTTERYDAEYGEQLVGFTDGVIEVHAENGEMLGEERIELWLKDNPQISCNEMANRADKFADGAEQADDITIIKYECQQLALEKVELAMPTTPFNIEMELNAAHIRESDPVKDLIDRLSSTPAFSSARSHLFTVLSELYNNALDHGILCLDSELKDTPEGFMEYFELRTAKLEALQDAFIHIQVAYEPNPARFILKLSDSGKGFNYQEHQANLESDQVYGRGIALVKELVSEINYANDGSSVQAVMLV